MLRKISRQDLQSSAGNVACAAYERIDRRHERIETKAPSRPHMVNDAFTTPQAESPVRNPQRTIDHLPLQASPLRTVMTTEILQPGAWGGAERSLVALANWMEMQHLPHRMVVYRDTLGIAARANHTLEVKQLLPGRGPANKIFALRAALRNDPSAWQAPLLSGYQAALHGILAGLRCFHTLMHDTPSLMSGPKTHRIRTSIANSVVGYGLRRAERLGGYTIVTSEYLRDECRRAFGVDSRIARMGGLEAPADLPVRPVAGSLQLLSVSRLEHNKRIDWILNSLGEMERDAVRLSARVNWRFDIAGAGTARELLEEQAQRLGIADRVSFRGFVTDAELDELYGHAHLFLMPAVQGYGIPAIEALQRGTPVLLHRESGVSDILLNTPWATVLTGGAPEMTSSLRQAIDGVIDGRHIGVPLPNLPTEESWARRVVELCGWT